MYVTSANRLISISRFIISSALTFMLIDNLNDRIAATRERKDKRHKSNATLSVAILNLYLTNADEHADEKQVAENAINTNAASS